MNDPPPPSPRFIDSIPKNSLTPQEFKRQEVINELITTEKQYVQSLRLLIKVTTLPFFFYFFLFWMF